MNRFSFGHRDIDNVNILSSSLACLSTLFSFFGVRGIVPGTVEDSVSRIFVAYDAFITIYEQCVLNRNYRQVFPTTYLDTFHLIFLGCELSVSRGLNCSIVDLCSETGCLWLRSQSDIKRHGGWDSNLRRLTMFCCGGREVGDADDRTCLLPPQL